MSSNWLRRAVLALASASALLVAACGSGTVESQLQPSRIISFGDALSDMGQTSNTAVTNARYTVNLGAEVNVWTQYIASRYAVPLAPAVSGGLSYAVGNARVNTHPDAAGNNATPTVKEQIDTFLAANTLGKNDLVLMNGGMSDVVAEGFKFASGTQTRAQAVANAQQAGRDLGAQVRRLVLAGGTHVVVAGPYDLSRSPWSLANAAAIGPGLNEVASKFNEQLLLSIVDLGASVHYADAAFFFNLMTSGPANYNMTNVSTPVCNSIDPGPGIGRGSGQVNSALCTTATVINPAYNTHGFADSVYFTPEAHRRFGEFAFDQIRKRW